jgi:cytochrome c
MSAATRPCRSWRAGRWRRPGGVAAALLGIGLATAALAAAAASGPEGDPRRGAAAFQRCIACHSVQPGVHLSGPSLARIWGRRAGSVEGYTRYSEPLRKAPVVWDAPSLDRWLADPQTVVPGTVMTLPPIADPRERADLVAYLRALSAGQAPAPPAGRPMRAGPIRTDLRALGPEHHVRAIRRCGDGYHVSMGDGRTLPYWEYNLRFKTDGSPQGPPPGRPVLVPSGMQGDRAAIVFASPAEISRMIEERCS